MMKKYFSSGFFLNFKSKLSAFQRFQPELLRVSEQKLIADILFLTSAQIIDIPRETIKEKNCYIGAYRGIYKCVTKNYIFHLELF